MTTTLASLVIAGTAPDGPVGVLTVVPLANPAEGYERFGFRKKEYATLSPGSVSYTLTEKPENLDVRFLYIQNKVLKEVVLYSLGLQGTKTLIFETPAIATAIPGWFDYTVKETAGDLSRNLRQVVEQSRFTAPEDGVVHVLRVVGVESQPGVATRGPVTATTLYPTSRYNGWILEIGAGTLELYAHASTKTLKHWSYSLDQTVESLKRQISFDYLTENFPFRLQIDLAGHLPATQLTTSLGTTAISGGVTANPTPEEYARALDDVPLELCDVIVLPGLAGRCFFPYTQDLFDNHIGYPFSFVCPTCSYTVDPEEVKPDLWQSDRLHLVAGATEGVS